MKNITLADITIKQSAEQNGFSFSFREKIELAKLLDKVGVPVIETGSVKNVRTDSLLIKSLAGAVRESTIAAELSIADEDSLEVTWKAIKEAARPRLQVPAPVSTVRMEYISHIKPAKLLEKIPALISAAKEVCPEVEFIAEDAGRSDPEFLKKAAEAAACAGADIVTICDTAGNLLPKELHDSVEKVKSYLPGNVRLGVLISNDLSLAEACAMAAIQAGADEVKTTAYGDFTVSLEKIVRVIKARGSEYDVCTSVRDTELKRTVNQIARMAAAGSDKRSAYDSSVHDESDAVLTIHDDMTSVMKSASAIGYDLSEDDAVKVYEAFVRIASKKESVGIKELDAIVASAAMQVPPTYKLDSYVINSGNLITATSHIRLEKDGVITDGLAVGDGPVDASFLAIEQIVGRHFELDDLQVQAVTEGREAMGETIVRLRSPLGKVYSGRGISTDIIGSSIRAYVSAVNKIVYEEGEA